MIPLILFPSMRITFTGFVFKFHYDFINSEISIGTAKSCGIFKFQYDSINSSYASAFQVALNHLNSIMFLLIPFFQVYIICCYLVFKFHYVSINSDCSLCKKHISQDFKFHYVSINSARSKTRTFNLPNFKFHYVSINSKSNHPAHVKVQCFKFHYVSINSKFLIAQHKGLVPLNSIMFLLILNQVIGLVNSVISFKFHYVSINSNL